MMLTADAPDKVENTKAAILSLLPPEELAAATKAAKASMQALAIEDDDDDDDEIACVGETQAPKPAPAAPEPEEDDVVSVVVPKGAVIIADVESGGSSSSRRRKAANAEKQAAFLPPPQLSAADAAKVIRRQSTRSLGKDDTAQAGMAAAAALGFNVLPKASSVPEGPAPGLRPTINAGGSSGPTQMASVLDKGMRVCTQYLNWARCDRGAACPEAHIVDPEEEMRVRAKFKLQMCNQGASCTRKSCLFRHPGEAVDEAHVPSGLTNV